MKIIFTIDFLTHSSSDPVRYHNWFLKLVSSLIFYSTGQKPIELKNYDINGETFNRDKFYGLSNIKDVDFNYYLYDINKITDESWDYLFKFIDDDTFIIGFELGMDLREKFTQKGINFINFWVHSFKLFDDVAFMINTNNKEIYDKLQKYKIPEIKFKLYTDYWKVNINGNNRFDDSVLQDNSVVFIGQTFKDSSVRKNGQYLNILNYKDKLYNLSKTYDVIYYVPHPCVPNIKEVDEYINATSYIQKLENIPTYYLLTSDKIKKVIALSSSVLYEAQYFSKDIEYLFRPLFNIDGEFGLNTFTSILNDYFNPYFWSDILSPVMETNQNIENEILFSNSNNNIREAKNLYWGYLQLDKTKVIQSQILSHMQQIENNANNIAACVNNQHIALQKHQELLSSQSAHLQQFQELLNNHQRSIEKINKRRNRFRNFIKKLSIKHLVEKIKFNKN